MDDDLEERLAEVQRRTQELAARVANLHAETAELVDSVGIGDVARSDGAFGSGDERPGAADPGATGQAEVMPNDEAPEARPGSGGVASWLFARRPVRAEHPGAAPDGAGERDDEVAPVSTRRRPRPTRDSPDGMFAPADVAGERQEATAAATAGANTPPEPESRPEDEADQPQGSTSADGPGAPPESAIAAASAGRRHRPRPSAAAPLVYDDVPSTPEQKPGDTFFTRKDDDEPADSGTKTPAEKKARPEKKAPAEKKVKKRTGMPSWVRRLRSLVIIAIVAVAAAFALRAYVVAPYYVPSASMEPTLHGCPGCNDDRVMVEKLSYDFHDPRRGDVIVFDRPSTWQVPDKVLIKRVIGVSGDRITIRNGHVFVNGSMLDEPYVNQKCKPLTTGSLDSARPRTFRTVPNGDLFVMGDNRCDSEDSRAFGVVPTGNVIGRAFLIVWPLGRLHSL